ncbi:TPA: DUF2635 domain-containing protein [Klebsiella pneumoniae]|uniref:DUF2635 domain-containing protein n=1 Tax=Klebsiella michiganensis TaxID=1134687 RepID=UPI000E2B5B51|nr:MULTISPECIES: DUF2635 domain-containing protein [Klebsiella]ELT9688836.1 DUF2635 domain-containing protein [Klebsiella michiganensis]ELT9692361.1 DUF2635 domain-containing protein [Klebsiella michiganensis]MDQ5603757.1 DUF2635 domain-containing protein [Klebsiella pneumoniae]SVW95385.1 Protein of uncharacterised function (DUF2635) [Klebsiella pneumoniae]HDY7188164.1 DUF2635 domain-containing protein [Klebsiella pneumoniae]
MKKHIKPARAGLQVRKADGQHLNPEGEALPVSAWWLRREAEGDVVITDIQAESVTETAEPVTEPAEVRQTRTAKEK